MEIISAILISLLISFILISFIWSKRNFKLNKIKYRQSDHHEFVKNFLYESNKEKTKKQTQLTDREEKNKITIIMTDEQKAYWVVNNTFFVCDVVDGNPDFDNGYPVNTENLSNNELDKLMFILDNLDRGDENERGSSRDK